MVHRDWEGVSVLTIALPQIPSAALYRQNIAVYAGLGWWLVRNKLKECDLLDSANLYPAGYIGGVWAKRSSKPHITEVVGSDINIRARKYIPYGEKDKFKQHINGAICRSKETLATLNMFIPDLKRVCVIYRGVDLNTFSPIGPVAGPQVSRPPVRFLYLGGFQTWNPEEYADLNAKGGHILLDTWRKAELELGDSSLFISGPGVILRRLEGWRATLQKPYNVFFSSLFRPIKSLP